jgi:SAM-dependent methyltransferase
MRRKLLNVLADPSTGRALALADDPGGEEIEEGVLVSEDGARYPIVRGIPRFVTQHTYGESFGLQWNRFARVQLDSHTGAGYSRRRFDTEVGWTAAELGGEWVLDAGCGSGRFAEIASGYGAEVLAVDLSSAVEAARDNLSHLPNVHVVQADLRALPFRPEVVGHLYSIGVLQHTPDPIESVRRLVSFLSSKGRFAFTIYGRAPWTKLYSKYWLRPLTTRVEPARLLGMIERAMPVLYPATSALFRLPLIGHLFRFVIPVANYVERRDLPASIRYQEAVLDTFDMLSPRYDTPVTLAEVVHGLSGLVTSLEYRSSVPVVIRGVRK